MSIIFQAISFEALDQLPYEFLDFQDYLEGKGKYTQCEIHYAKQKVFKHCYCILFSDTWEYNDYYDYLDKKAEFDGLSIDDLELEWEGWWEQMIDSGYVVEIMV